MNISAISQQMNSSAMRQRLEEQAGQAGGAGAAAKAGQAFQVQGQSEQTAGLRASESAGAEATARTAQPTPTDSFRMTRISELSRNDSNWWRSVNDKMQNAESVHDMTGILRDEINKRAAAGKSGPMSDMLGLLSIQYKIQGAALKLELSTKIVEHATSGVKTVLQTQA